jgi:cytochrome b pre-mRNA-processing protein 3
MSIWPFGPSKAAQDGERLLKTIIKLSRRAAFFGECRVPDNMEGRFEVVALHAWLALMRLRGEPGAEPLAQTFTDRLFRHLDAGLREAGTGDLTVPKHMRKLAASFYGRLEAYGAARNDHAALAAALARNMLGPEDHPYAGDMARYVQAAVSSLHSGPVAALFEPSTWPAPAP